MFTNIICFVIGAFFGAILMCLAASAGRKDD